MVRQTLMTGPRGQLIQTLFPDGVPRLWCPTLTHYAEGGKIDRTRLRAHLRSMQPWVKGFLIPGSTGEGWEMNDAEIRDLLGIMIDEAREVKGHILVGILKTNAADVASSIAELTAWLQTRTGTSNAADGFAASGICGLTVCPPTGADLSQEAIQVALEGVLSLGIPVSLYQLPQVTQNEMSPQVLTGLAARYANFYLFKDTSGADQAAKGGLRDVFMVRGAEGDYTSHLAEGGGAYDGFLLSTANCFGKQLAGLIDDMQHGRRAEADAFSATLSGICARLFPLAGAVGFGNAFTNANKAMDHFMAHGPEAAKVPAPLLYSGKRLPASLIEAAGKELASNGLMPQKGYLQA